MANIPPEAANLPQPEPGSGPEPTVQPTVAIGGTNRAGVSDSIIVEHNGEVVSPETKGPAEDRLANHDAEVAAWEARLAAEAAAAPPDPE